MSSHDDPLQELIDAAEAVVNGGDRNMRGHYTEMPWSLLANLNNALAPFRPNPEEELIEAMTEAYAKERDFLLPGSGIVRGMRAALAVIKEKGYFNDQR